MLKKITAGTDMTISVDTVSRSSATYDGVWPTGNITLKGDSSHKVIQGFRKEKDAWLGQ